MKKLTFLLMAITMMATGSHAMGQLDGGNGWTFAGPQPEPPNPASAFYASLNAYQVTQSQAYYWQSLQPYHPNAATAATYFQISANYQYQSMVRLYAVWQGIEDRGYVMPIDRQLAEEAETYAQYAGWYALAGASITTSNVLGHPAFMATADSYDKIELLVRKLDSMLDPWDRPEPQYDDV